VNRTTKTLLAIGGVIVLSYPGVAWVSGIVIESRIQHTERQMLDQVPYFTLVKREYHRGVYRSTEIATYGFRSPVPQSMNAAGGAALPPAATITVESDIQHGPFPGAHAMALAVVDSTLVTPPALQSELGSKSLLRVHTLVGLFGGTTTNVMSPAASVRLADGSSLAWGGLTGTVTTHRAQTGWSGMLSAPRLAFTGPQGGIELTGLEYSGSHQEAFDGLYLGAGTLTIERLDGTSPRSGDYSLQRISISSTSKADGEFFDMRVDAGMDAARIAAVQLKNVVYSESFEHIHGPTFASMTQAIRQAQHQAGANQQQLEAGLQEAVRRYGVDLLLQDPVLEIRQVSFAMPEGSFLLSARISAPGLSRADLQWPAAILALKSHAAVTADLRVDNGLVRKLLSMGGSSPRIGAQLASFEQQGYLTAGSTAVTTHLDYSGGRLTLNGHAFPPAPPVH
jgi:uncharacterized protein YdgA (DUF945 family)